MLFNHKIIVTLLIFLMSFMLSAQKQRADKLYDKAQYYKAIPKYLKAIRSNDTELKKESLTKLADCYRILNDYPNAVLYYKQALDLGGKINPEVYFNYGNVLKSNGNYQEALNNYTVYLNSNPTDKKGTNAIKSCREIKYWQSKPQEYKVENADLVNTKQSEFCPIVLNDQLVYVAEKQRDYVEFTTNGLNGQPYLDIYFRKLKSDVIKSRAKLFSKKINTLYHDGPVSFSADGKKMYLTRVNYKTNKRNPNFVNRAKLYVATANGKKWKTPQPFQYNSDDYSCAHASISNDGEILYFASDMPGGYGGKDIWLCKKNGDAWSNPINLGPDINTSADEMFPYSKKDGTLYFSSNGLPGFGGLDIYSAKFTNGIWLLNKNEGLKLNSNADDFGIVFTTDSTGYFSSNREGGKGKDDIYSFLYESKYTIVDGTVLLTENINDPAQNVKVFLLDSNGKRIDSTKTNKAGYFVFRNLEVDKTYLAEIDDDDIDMKFKARYYLADKNNKIARITHKQPDGKKFVFRNLPVDVNGLPDLYNEDDLSLGGNLLFGENPSKPIANKKVVIRNEYGDILEETITNEFGAFVFRNLPIDQNYTLTVEDDDLPSDMKIILTNKSGKQVKIGKEVSKGKFQFRLLSVDKSTLSDLDIEDVDMIMSLKGYLYDQNKKILPLISISVYEGKQVIETIKSDKDGKFQFKNLGATKSYYFDIDNSDIRFNNVSIIYLADAKGRIYKELRRAENGKFQFRLLEIDKTALGDFTVDDPWLQVLNLKLKTKKETITIIENLTYAYGDYKIDAAGQNILDKVITVLNSNPKLNIELSSHTDSRSTDSYNLQLSQKRAKSAVDYLIAKGISTQRLKAIGYGETKLLNDCGNNKPCTEEEHAKNRRTEFKIVEALNK